MRALTNFTDKKEYIESSMSVFDWAVDYHNFVCIIISKTHFFDNITKRYKIPWIGIWNLIFTSITGMVDQAVVIISEEFSLTDAQKAQANARRTAKHQVIYTERFSLIIWRL